ncbi:TRAP transporter small permease [Arenibacterium halophilum]|uniref:TRAP transporter small permease protein n=1 Tax=Arenibacterium halophilum TaxID=2583821 RepID=A0ABY2XED9_9RHOB|nr:TRAP transporter small permease subunit [Arenibacterium halophilum]TMV15382.1 TRAP transporter small permease subunit [Arenibacterium halophilum]
MTQVTQTDSAPGVLARIDSVIARAETVLIGALMLAIFGLLMLNVISRSIGSPVIWVDEAAVFLMIWVALTGASLALFARQHLAVTLLPDLLSESARHALARAVDVLLFGFFLLFAVILWMWFDPITLWQAGSVREFSRATFNFLYQEPTVTLGIRKIWFWLAMPVFCFCGLVHTGAHILGRGGVRT